MRLARQITVGAVLYAALCWSCSLCFAATPQRTSTRNVRSGDVQYGIASWYGRHWRGRRTASGAFFDDRALTAAHRTLPLGSKVQVTNLKNGQSVLVSITDRGPHVHRRLIDLSRAAAARIGFTHRGLARVRVQVVSTGSEPASGSAEPIPTSPGQQ
jgi:rare lipoprotein A (peptidoglycan hydrolase)